MIDLNIYDDVLPEALAYRAQALAWPFQRVTLGPTTFHGIAVADDTIPAYLRELGLNPTLSFVRRSPEGQDEPHYIHTDVAMGDWTALYYMNPEPAHGDGTKFWDGPAVDADLTAAVDDLDCTLRATVDAVFNRLVVFPSHWLHSRALRNNYGSGESARLVQVTFGGY